MSTAHGMVKGVLYFIIAILFIITSYYTVTIFDNLFTTPLLKVIFWTGLITTYAVHTILVPYLLITSKIELDLKKVGYGAICFFTGLIYTLITWYIIPDIINLFFVTLWNNPTLYGIFHTCLILSYILLIFIIPNLLIFSNTKVETE